MGLLYNINYELKKIGTVEGVAKSVKEAFN